MGDNRPSVYVEELPDGQKQIVYRASSVGGCIRVLVASSMGHEERRGQKMDDLLERSAEEGNIHEPAIRAAVMEKYGLELVEEQDEVEITILPGLIIRGHNDGVLAQTINSTVPAGTTEHILLEAKTMSTKQFAKWQSGRFKYFEKYAFQISIYMKMNPGHDVIYAVKRREDGMMDYMWIKHDQPPIEWKRIMTKILLAEKARRKDAYPACDVANTWGCPFWYLHDEKDPEEEDEDLSDDEVKILGELSQGYLELKAVEDAGKEAESLRKAKFNVQLMNMLGEKPNVVFNHDGTTFKVRRGGGGGSSFDKAKFIEDHGQEEYDKYVSKYSYSYPIVRIIPDEG